jgi:hypothetical protein
MLAPSAAIAAPLESPKPDQQTQRQYLLDRVVTWADGTTEHVQIGKDYFFRLDGVKKRLVGMDMSSPNMPFGQWNEFYIPENLAIYDKELAYMHAAGIRLVHMSPYYIADNPPGISADRERYTAFFNLVYKHKMFLIAHIVGKWENNFGNLDNPDFAIGPGDTMGAWTNRMCEILSGYQNVVAVVADNELDNPLSPPDIPIQQAYTISAVSKYMDFLTGIIRSKLPVPVIHNLMGCNLEPQIKQVCLAATDFPCFTMYTSSTAYLNDTLTNLELFIKGLGYSSDGWWFTELNKLSKETEGRFQLDVDNFTPEYINEIFNHGASVVVLYRANDASEPTNAFFDTSATPKPPLDKVVAQLGTLQAAIPELPAIATSTLNGNLTSDGGTATTVSVYWGPIDIGTTAASWANNVPPWAKAVDAFPANIPGLTAWNTCYYRCKNPAGSA